MSRQGIDFAWGSPSPAALKRAGVTFVCRYLSPQPNPKNLTPSEAKRYTDAGVDVVVVWESTANRMLAGGAAGQQDARDAAHQAAACGMPAGRPIYFACDFDATPGQQRQIDRYLRGAEQVLGKGRVGIYGGFYPVSRALTSKAASWGWQTYAWSGGQWDKRAHIQQFRNNVTIAGVSCDLDRALKADFGQWGAHRGADPKRLKKLRRRLNAIRAVARFLGWLPGLKKAGEKLKAEIKAEEAKG